MKKKEGEVAPLTRKQELQSTAYELYVQINHLKVLLKQVESEIVELQQAEVREQIK